MTNSAKVWEMLKKELQTGLTLSQAQLRSWRSLLILTCTSSHGFTNIYSDFVKITNQLCLHNSTAINNEIFVRSLLSRNIKVEGLREFNSLIILYPKTVTAQNIMDTIKDKALVLTTEVSQGQLSMKTCQLKEEDVDEKIQR